MSIAWPLAGGSNSVSTSGPEIVPGTLVITREGELGEAAHSAFGVVAVRLSSIGYGGPQTTTYHAASDLTPVVCPADVVTSEELAALQGDVAGSK
ncbi:MAG TPA: hypothetical protein VFE58_19615 [Tepidisphaeraceae bacterium]|nr:hypothetical protein [Tepidisphaeraceae bacterium]